MDPNNDGVITIEEFITNYLESEKILKERLEELVKTIAENKQRRDDIAVRQKETAMNEQTN